VSPIRALRPGDPYAGAAAAGPAKLLEGAPPCDGADGVIASRHELFDRYHTTRDARLRQALVAEFMPLARHLALRYRGACEPLDDLIQVASIGLLKAIDRFDPNKGFAFSSFAVPTILGELRRHFRDRTWSIKVPRDLQERVLKVERVTEELHVQLRRPPTPAEVAVAIDGTVEQVMEALQARGAYRPASLDEPYEAEGNAEAQLPTVASHDAGYARAEAAATVEGLLANLTPRQREILRLRFHEDLTQDEIGARIGTSQMQVSRLLRQTITQLQQTADAS
jgi:RNA polymerase sigma-B factor